MTDLSLVPIDDLVKEMESRCPSFIIAYETYKDQKSMLWFQYGKGTWYQAVRLASILNNDVLNNWNGEMKYLQRRNEEEGGG